MSVLSHTATSPASRGEYYLSRIIEGLSFWWRTYTVWRNRQLAVNALRKLDDHMLRDIGIDRSEIESVVYTGARDRKITFRHS
jgi:uncharacterized protein YjiS (DUF1127 family)